MIKATFEQIDHFYTQNGHFNRHVLSAYYGWNGTGYRLDEEFLHLHAKNDRFELMVDTDLICDYDEENYLVLDGRRHLLNDFDSWEQVEEEINKRL